jgi:hypothetical protein
VCAAYPEGIPEDMLENTRRHDAVQHDQTGEWIRVPVAEGRSLRVPGAAAGAVLVRLAVCTGTTCYVLGGSDLFPLPESLPEYLQDLVEVVGSPCLGYCRDPRNGRPPFVMVGETLLAEATLPRLVEALDAILDGKED